MKVLLTYGDAIYSFPIYLIVLIWNKQLQHSILQLFIFKNAIFFHLLNDEILLFI